MFGLDTDTIRNIKNCLAKIPQIQKVLLYGSRAKGNYKNGSDIDLILIGKNLNPDDSIYPLKEELNKLYLPYTFDISILSKLDKLEFINRILKVGKTFYQKETNELPAGWQQKKLGDVCEVINGGTPKTNIKEYWDGNILWITPKDLGRNKNIFVDDTIRKITVLGLKKSSAQLIPANSIILSTRAPIGYLAINKIEISTNQGCRGVVPSKKIKTIFLYYFLKNSIDLLNKLGRGTTFKELSATSLSNIIIPIPPLAEQKRIVAILDKTFTAIDKIKNNTEKNLANTKELWQNYLQQSFNNPKKNWQQKKLTKIEEVFSRGSFCNFLKFLKSNCNFPKFLKSNRYSNDSNTSFFLGSKSKINLLKFLRFSSFVFSYSIDILSCKLKGI